MGHQPVTSYSQQSRSAPRGAYRGVLIAVLLVGSLILPMLLCVAASDVSQLPGCLFTVTFFGLPTAGLLWWLRERQQQQDAALAYSTWMAWQEYQRQAMLAAQEHERRVAHEGWVVEQQRQQRLMHLKTLGDLLAMTPTEFERAIADILPSLGFVDVEHTGNAGDFGVDIQCLTRSQRTVIVHCKQNWVSKKVPRREVQTFLGALMHFDADMGLFITTSSFTHEARVLAHQHSVMAVDGEMLTQLIHKVQEKLDQSPN